MDEQVLLYPGPDFTSQREGLVSCSVGIFIIYLTADMWETVLMGCQVMGRLGCVL